MRQFLSILFFGLAACQPPPNTEAEESAEPDEQAPATDAEASANIPITAVGDLVGEYRVAGIDGEPLDADFGIALSIDGPMISFEPTCVGFVWNFRFDGERFVTLRERTGTPPAPGEPPTAVCAVAVSSEQRQLATALDAVSRAERTPANAVLLSGAAHSVTLFTQ